MKDDIVPANPEQNSNKKLKPPFLSKKKPRKKPKPKKIHRPKPKPKTKPPKPKPLNPVEVANRLKRREMLKKQEKLGKRGDLVFFWVIISFLVLTSLLTVSYLFLKQQWNQQAQQTVQQEETTKEEATVPVSQSDFFLYLSSNQDRAAVYKDYFNQKDRETVVAFTPPAEITDLDADWDGDHSYVFVDNKGVEVYNSNTKKKSILAPNRGDREYFEVNFASTGKIGTLHRKNKKNYLEVYSSSLKQEGKKRRVTDFRWTKDGQLSYIINNRGKNIYKFFQYNSKDSKFVEYFKDYFDPDRYPLDFEYSANNKSVAFLLRDNQSSQSKVILAVGELRSKKMTKIAELLFFNASVKDSSIIRPTIIWDKKEDYIYVSLNNRVFKVDLTSYEAQELNLDFPGTAELLSPNRSQLFIRKSDSGGEIEEPENGIIYDLSANEITQSTSLARIVGFIAYQYFGTETE